MSVTQDYKNVQLSPDEITLIVDGLLELEEKIVAEIADNEAVDWQKSAAQGRRDLSTVRELVLRLGAK